MKHVNTMKTDKESLENYRNALNGNFNRNLNL